MNSILPIVLLLTLCTSAKSSFDIEIKHKQRSTIRLTEKWNKKLLGPYGKKRKIVGGLPADVGRYPYMVSLLENDYPFCGGTLIDSEWVISAAHCARYATHVLLGHHDFNNIPDTAEKIAVSYEIKHPSYDYSTLENDVLMIKLANQSSFPVIDVDTDHQDIPEKGVDVTVIGWGTTASGGVASDVLLEVEVQTVSNEDCADVYGPDASVTDTMICAAAEGKDSCQGDSGGPLIIKGSSYSDDVQVGIVSWGFGCADPEYPGVYASTDGLGGFIAETIENSTAPDDDGYGNDYGYDDVNCGFPEDGFDYSNCDVNRPCWIGDNYCDGGEYNTAECNYEAGDCEFDEDDFPDDGFDYSGCNVLINSWIGDDYCDDSEYNTPECNYDGRDCPSPDDDCMLFSMISFIPSLIQSFLGPLFNLF